MDINFEEVFNNRENDNYCKFLSSLIQIASNNQNEEVVAKKIEEFLKEVHISSEILPLNEEKKRASLIASLNDNYQGKILIYNAHMDTVDFYPEKWTKGNPLSGYYDEKVIEGVGAADTKGGLVAMAIALKILKKSNLNLSGNLILNAVAAEEEGNGAGTLPCIEFMKKKAMIPERDTNREIFVIVAEPSSFLDNNKSIIVGEKGSCKVNLEIKGKAGHSSTPFLGENAIEIMAEIIHTIREKFPKLFKVKFPIKVKVPISKHSEEYIKLEKYKNAVKIITSSIVDIKVIKSNELDQALNTIIDNCCITIDFRFLPDQDPQQIKQALLKLIRDLGLNVREKDEEVKDLSNHILLNYRKTPFKASHFNNYKNSIPLQHFYEDVTKFYNPKNIKNNEGDSETTPFFYFYPAGTDAEYYRDPKLGNINSTIVFGPGKFERIHRENEYLDRSDFINAIKVYAAFAIKFLKE